MKHKIQNVKKIYEFIKYSYMFFTFFLLMEFRFNNIFSKEIEQKEFFMYEIFSIKYITPGNSSTHHPFNAPFTLKQRTH